jgi:hypothetical protein
VMRVGSGPRVLPVHRLRRRRKAQRDQSRYTKTNQAVFSGAAMEGRASGTEGRSSG